MLHAIANIAFIALIVGVLAAVIIPAYRKNVMFLREQQDEPINLYRELIDADYDEHDIELRLVAGISLEEQYREAVEEGFIVLDDLPSPEEQAILNRRFSPVE